MTARAETVAHAQCPYCHQVMKDAPSGFVIDTQRLTDSERLILEQLSARMGVNTHTDVLINALYGLRPDGGPLAALAVVRVYICRLRKVLPKAYRIENAWGFGYRLEAVV